ncbi:MAG: class I SAM-dependent methyltransferase, partial [Verrucomicrobiales bacterium]
MSHEQHRDLLSADLKRLEKQLTRLCQDRLTLTDSQRLRVLDVACGECFEAETLQRVLRKMAAEEGRERDLAVDFIGADIRESEIARAAERCENGEDGVDYRFLVKDGQKLTRDADLAEGFDVVFVRHQNYYLGGKEWHEIFEQSLE